MFSVPARRPFSCPAPWISGSTVTGVIGGLHGGGCAENLSYSSPFDEHIAELFAGEGLQSYLGEDVSIAVHMLQAGALAEGSGAPDPLVAAALLHGMRDVLTPFRL